MTGEIGVCEVDGEARCATRLDTLDRAETEQSLEDILAANPELLMKELVLVGRQVPVGAGALDLLGVDGDGRLVVFELKRQKLTRDAVAQVLDYCSYLEALSESELATLIKNAPSSSDIAPIDDLQEWYGQNQEGSLDSLRPVRMALVGLGVDEGAQRMVEYLVGRGIDISLITFHAFARESRLLLARQVRTLVDRPPKGRTPNKATVVRKAQEAGIADLWQEAARSLDHAAGKYYTQSGVTFFHKNIPLEDGVRVRGSHSVTVDGKRGIRVTFYPASIHLCPQEFEGDRDHFKREKPPNAPRTSKVNRQWYCRLDSGEWTRRRARLTKLVRAVEKAWRKRERETADA